MSNQENPPAFPQTRFDGMGHGVDPASDAPTWVDGPGMTLRDWFAGQALAARAVIAKPSDQSPEDFYNITALVAYRFADAMLAERAKVSA